MDVFAVLHIHQFEDDEGMRVIGVYSTEEGAQAAIGRLREKPGFRDSPDGFLVQRSTIDTDSWREGFGTIAAVATEEEAPSGSSCGKAPDLEIARDQLPVDPSEWGDLAVSFPSLAPDTAESCPEPLSEILDYVNRESSDYGCASPERLKFLRTAQVGDQSCWLWSYCDSGGDLDYVVCRKFVGGGFHRSMSSVRVADDGNPLTPEQYLLATYYGLVYW